MKNKKNAGVALTGANLAIVIIFGLIIVGLIIFLFIGDGTSKDVLAVGNVDYEVDDFISYVRTWQQDATYSDFDTYIQNHGSSLKEGYSESDYMNEIFSTYQIYKVYAQEADKLGIELTEDEMPAELESGDLETLESDFGITSGEYYRVQTEIAKANKLFSDVTSYIPVEDTMVDFYLSRMGYNPDSIYNTYKYRVIQVPVAEVPEESGDESGDVSGEIHEAKVNKAKEDAKQEAEALKLLAETAVKTYSGEITLDELNTLIADVDSKTSGDIKLVDVFADLYASGDDGSTDSIFGYIGRAVSYQRYSQNGLGFKTVENGDLDSVSALYIQQDLLGSSSYAAMFSGSLYSTVAPLIIQTGEGNCSEVFDNSSDYGFVFVEEIDNKLSDQDQSRFDNAVVNYYIQSSIEVVIKNKARFTKLRIEDLCPIVKRKAEETANEVSGEEVDPSAIDMNDLIQIEPSPDGGSEEEPSIDVEAQEAE